MGNKVLVTVSRPFLEEEGTIDTWEGNYEAGMAPNGSLIISEEVPDMDPKNPTGKKPKMVALYHHDHWEKVEIV